MIKGFEVESVPLFEDFHLASTAIIISTFRCFGPEVSLLHLQAMSFGLGKIQMTVPVNPGGGWYEKPIDHEGHESKAGHCTRRTGWVTVPA